MYFIISSSLKDISNYDRSIISSHLIVHPEYISTYDEKFTSSEKFRPGKKRNDVCLIKMEHDETTKSFMPDKTPCRLTPPISSDFQKVKYFF